MEGEWQEKRSGEGREGEKTSLLSGPLGPGSNLNLLPELLVPMIGQGWRKDDHLFGRCRCPGPDVAVWRISVKRP